MVISEKGHPYHVLFYVSVFGVIGGSNDTISDSIKSKMVAMT